MYAYCLRLAVSGRIFPQRQVLLLLFPMLLIHKWKADCIFALIEK